MPSSTSTFRTEWKVLAVVAAALLAAEVSMRVVFPMVSVELGVLTREIPAEARRLSHAEGRQVLVIGNSMTERGLDPAALAERIQGRFDEPVEVVPIILYGSGITEWAYMIDRHFADNGHMPDVVCVNFHVYNPHHDDSSNRGVRDEPFMELKRLVYFLKPADLPEAAGSIYRSFDDRCHLFVGWVFRAVAGRGRIRNLMLLKLMPDYQTGLIRLGSLGENTWAARKRVGRQGGRLSEPQPTYERLTKLADLVEAHGCKLILVAMPYRDDRGYIPADLTNWAARRRVPLLDLRHPPGLDRDVHHMDTTHLNPDGKAVFTTIYADAISQVLAEVFAAPEQPTDQE